MVLALIAIWYIAAVAMNWSLVRDAFEREETPYTITDVLAGTMDAERPLLPAPHQVDLRRLSMACSAIRRSRRAAWSIIRW